VRIALYEIWATIGRPFLCGVLRCGRQDVAPTVWGYVHCLKQVNRTSGILPPVGLCVVRSNFKPSGGRPVSAPTGVGICADNVIQSQHYFTSFRFKVKKVIIAKIRARIDGIIRNRPWARKYRVKKWVVPAIRMKRKSSGWTRWRSFEVFRRENRAFIG